MSSNLVIVGIMSTSSGVRVIDANKNEYECRNPIELYNRVKLLLESKDLPIVETDGRKRKDVEHEEIKEKIKNSEEVIKEYVAQDYGQVVGSVVGKVAARGGSKLFGALRRISRK